MKLGLRAERWMQFAACRETDPEIFFPTDEERSTKLARLVCGECPVLHECRQWAMDDPDQEGIAGGLTAGERKRIREKAV